MLSHFEIERFFLTVPTMTKEMHGTENQAEECPIRLDASLFEGCIIGPGIDVQVGLRKIVG